MKLGAATEPVSVAGVPVKASAPTVPGVPVNVGAATEPAGVNAAVPFVPAGVNDTVPLVPVAVNVCVWVPRALPEKVGTPTGQDTVGCVNTPAAIVGTPAGHEFVPVGVTVWVCVPSAVPVKVCAVTVRFGAVALHAVADPVPAAMFVAAQFPLVALAPLVPAGVPPLTALVVLELPANVGTPAGQEIAPSLKAPLAFVGTPAGQATVPPGVPPLTADVVALDPVNVSAGTVPELPVKISAGTVPGVPVKAGAVFVPAGVKDTVPFEPAGV